MVSTDNAHKAHNDDSSSDYDSSSGGDEEQNSSSSSIGNKSVTKYTGSFKYRVSSNNSGRLNIQLKWS